MAALRCWRWLGLWLPVAGYMGAIFWLSSLSHPPSPPGVSDKWLHTLAYAGLAVVALRATSGGRWSGVTRGALAAAWLMTVSYGVSDEWHQAFTPGRTPDVVDVAADAIGALAGTGSLGAWSIIRRL
jgi:VanZ family protein